MFLQEQGQALGARTILKTAGASDAGRARDRHVILHQQIIIKNRNSGRLQQFPSADVERETPRRKFSSGLADNWR